jgi:hypothetical protein
MDMNFRKWLCIVSFLFPLTGYSQVNTFDHHFVYAPGHSMGDGVDYNCLAQMSDKGYFMCRSSSDTGTSGGDKQFVDLIRLDRAGHVFWGTRLDRGPKGPSFYTQDLNLRIGCTLVGTYDQGVVLGTSIFGHNRTPIAILVKTDSAGVALWARQYPGDGYSTVYCIKQTTDSGYIVCGSTGTQPTHRQPFLFKIDAAGHILWSRKIQVDADTLGVFNSVTEIAGQGYVAAGNSGQQALVVQVDLSGNKVWSKSLFRGYGDFNTCVQNTSNTLIVGGVYLDSLDTEPTLCLAQTDLAGNVTWQKKFQIGSNPYYGSRVWTMQTLPGGDFVIGGYIANPIPGTFLARLDYTGTPVWGQEYHSTYHTFGNSPFSLIQTTDLGYAISSFAGTYSSANVANFSTALLKTDENGLLGCDGKGLSLPLVLVNKSYSSIATISSTGVDISISPIFTSLAVPNRVVCETITDPGTAAVKESTPVLFTLDQNNPNPFSVFTTLDYTLQKEVAHLVIEIRDLTGVLRIQKVFESVGAGRHSCIIEQSGLPAGIYFYSLLGDGYRKTKKMLVENDH